MSAIIDTKVEEGEDHNLLNERKPSKERPLFIGDDKIVIEDKKSGNETPFHVNYLYSLKS